MKKTVNYPIVVPAGKYCWEYEGDYTICQFFDNEGGHANCTLGFDNDIKKSPSGVLKAKECSELKTVEIKQ